MLRLCGRRPNIFRRCLTSQEALETLGLKQGATKTEIREAYYEQAKRYHPDNQETGNGAIFKEVKIAADLLESYQPKRTQSSSQSSHQTKSRDTSKDIKYDVAADKGLSKWTHLAPFGIFFVLLMMVVAIAPQYYVYTSTFSEQAQPSAECVERYPRTHPGDPFLVQLVTVLNHIIKRENISVTTQELYCEYRNHIRLDAKLVYLNNDDMRIIGGICGRCSIDATMLMNDPSKLDSVLTIPRSIPPI